MKKPVFPRTVACLFFCSLASLSAQNLTSSNPSLAADPLKVGDLQGDDAPLFSESGSLSGKYDVPIVHKVPAEISDGGPVFATQDSLTLDTRPNARREVASVVDLKLLREPSPYRKVYVSAKAKPYEIVPNSLQNGLAQISAVYRESGRSSGSADCPTIALSVEQRVKLDPAKILEIVELEVAANPACACEVVKTAIKASEADISVVVDIVEVAISAAPDTMRIVSQCAIAQMPESLAAVQALLARLDPNSGEAGYSSKSGKEVISAKGAKVASVVAAVPPNPLDLPPTMPPITPPPWIPPFVTDVDLVGCSK